MEPMLLDTGTGGGEQADTAAAEAKWRHVHCTYSARSHLSIYGGRIYVHSLFSHSIATILYSTFYRSHILYRSNSIEVTFSSFKFYIKYIL